MIVRVKVDETAHVETSQKNLAVVVLLPVTRVTAKARANWEKILKILEDSRTPALVVLDKTPNEEASRFFEKHDTLSFTDIYLIRRPPNEPIYDSQKFIRISKRLWIVQLHDDDDWGGALNIPQNATELELFSTEFFFDDNTQNLDWTNSPPARINFTILPSIVWNRFGQFIVAQGGHVAGSMDSTLDLVSRAICNRRHISQFSYVYSNRHWKKKSRASENLETLAKIDGWSFMSCADIQLMNRAIDGICALEFFSDLIPLSRIDEYRLQQFKKLGLTPKRRILIISRYYATLLLQIFCDSMEKLLQQTFLQKRLIRLNQALLKYYFLLGITKSKNREELAKFVVELRESELIPELESRFFFWESMVLKPWKPEIDD
jgi:hypothetical protein